MHGICKPFQVNFHVLPFKNFQNTSHFVTLFSAHGDVVVRFAIFHIVSFQKKMRKKERKKAHLHGMWMLVGTRWNRLAMVFERKKVGRSAKLYKRAQKCQSLSKTCFIFVWKIVRTPLPVVDKNNHLSKPKFYLSVLQIKSSSTCLIIASLREGPFFYLYVESPPSTFMHHLREHSCHSEYNMHCPKVFIDWFIILVSLVLKLFVSSRSLKLEGVLCIYILLFHEGQAENYLLYFFLWFEHTFDFYCFIFMIFHLCSFSCYNMVAKFLLSRLYLSCPYFKFFWSQHTMLT
jgi:hypothetical protein